MTLRFWLFAGVDYYASGGVVDLRGRFDSVEAAMSRLTTHPDATRHGGWEWYQVVDVVEGRVIRSFGGGGYGTEYDNNEPIFPLPSSPSDASMPRPTRLEE